MADVIRFPPPEDRPPRKRPQVPAMSFTEDTNTGLSLPPKSRPPRRRARFWESEPTFVVVVVAVVSILSVGLAFWIAVTHEQSATIPLCSTEEASTPDPCIWNADLQGNGLGRSFLSVDGHTHYLD